MTLHRLVPLALLCFTSWMFAADSVELKRGQNQIEVLIGGKPFTTYFFTADTTKPYLMPLQSPSGVIVTRSFPVGNDVTGADTRDKSFEPHQRPLYFAHGNVDGLDFWQEQAFDRNFTDHGRQAYGHVSLKDLEEASEGRNQATVRVRFRLLDPNEREIAEQTQGFTFRGDGRTRTVDCEFVLYATAGPLVLGDIKEGTFGIRLTTELSAPHDHMLNSLGSRGEKAIWGKPADWVNYSGVVAGKPVGIVVFDSPLSFHHPTHWMARAYGLLAANPFGLREFAGDPHQDGSWTIPEGQSLHFRYRVVIYDGEFSSAELAEIYSRYAAEN
jgi:hypothetical protein